MNDIKDLKARSPVAVLAARLGWVGSAAKLKRPRKRSGLTQEQLADAAGISRTYLSRLETAMHDPTVGVVERLAKALKVKPTDLLK